MEDEKPNLKSIRQSAVILNVSPFSVRRRILAGELRAVYIGARRLIPTTELDRAIAEGVGSPRRRSAPQTVEDDRPGPRSRRRGKRRIKA